MRAKYLTEEEFQLKHKRKFDKAFEVYWLTHNNTDEEEKKKYYEDFKLMYRVGTLKRTVWLKIYKNSTSAARALHELE